MKPETKAAIDRYVKEGMPTGGFLHAVLTNDLFGAVERADEENLRDILDICSYIYNDVPGKAWGSPQKLEAWLQMHVERRKAKNEQIR